MQKGRVIRIRNKVISLLLTLCMVFTLLPGNDLAVYAEDPQYWVMNTPLAADAKNDAEGWSWNQDTKTLTFSKSTSAISKKGIAIKLPGGSTIVLDDGIRVEVKGISEKIDNLGTGMYCDGDLSIKGNGMLQIMTETPPPDDMNKNGEQACDYNEKLSALICDGKLVIGEADNKTAPYIYMAIAGGAYSDKTLYVKSALTGKDNPAVEIKSGQVNFGSAGNTNGKIWIGTSGSDGYVNLTGQSVLRDISSEGVSHDDEGKKTVCAHCTIYYENGKHGNLKEGFYYGTNDYHRYVKYLSDPNSTPDLATGTNATKNEPLRELIGSKADLTVAVTGRDDFIGWSLDKAGASGILRTYTIPKPSDGNYEASIQSGGTIYMYAMYGQKSNYKEATPSAAINYKESKLTALVEGGNYTIKIADKDGSNEKALLTNAAVDSNGEYTISDLPNYFENGGKITITKTGEDGFQDSQDQVIEILQAGDAPTRNDFTITDPTAENSKTNIKISSAFEYKKSGESNWTAATETTATTGIDLEPNTSIEVRKAITEDAPASKSLTITAKTIEATPNPGIDYKASKVTGLANGKYTIKAGSQTIVDRLETTDGTFTISNLEKYYGQTLTVVKLGDGETTCDSAPGEVKLKSKDGAPGEDKFSVTEATKENSNAIISGIDSTYEYSVDGGKTWEPGSDDEDVEVRGGQSVLVRVPATEDTPASESHEIKTQPAPNQEDTPEAGVNYKEGKLTNLVGGAKYKIDIADGGYREYTADSDGKIAIPDFTSHYGDTISIIKAAGDESKTDSAAQTVILKTRDDASAPNRDDYTVTQAVNGKEKATIDGITSTQEYSEDGGKTWKPGDGSPKDVEAGTDILIRNAATDDTPESNSITISTDPAQTPEDKPENASVDYLLSALTGLESDEEYIVTVDGEEIASGSADDNGRLPINNVLSYAGKEISVVKKGNGSTTYDSEPQTILIKGKGAAPSKEDFEIIDPADGSTETTIKGITEKYEYRIENGMWQDGSGSDVIIPAETSVEIRVKATASDPESEILTISTKKPEKKPNASVDYKIPGLTGLNPDADYIVTVDGDTIAEGKADADGNLKIDDLLSNSGKEISVVKKGGENTSDSEPQVIPIKAKGDAPSKDDFEVVDPTVDKPETIIKNITDEYEYRIGDGEWTDGDGSDVEVPAGETIEIRKKATEDTPESESLKITAKDTFDKTPEEKPDNADIDYTLPGLTGLEPGAKYEVTVEGETIANAEADKSGNLKIDDLLSNGGKEISVVKKGDEEATTDSEPKIILIEAKGDAPSKDDFEVVDPTGDKTSTIIKNITDEYEYRIGDGEWTDGDGSDVEVPAGETIEIRKKATANAPESESLTITAKDVKTREATPTAGIDYTAEKLTGLVPNAEYIIKVDGKTIIFKADAAGKTDLNTYYGKTISVIKRGNGTTTEDSAEQKLTVSAKTAAPSEDQFDVQPDENGGNVVIKNVSGDYEYSINNGVSWTTGNGKDITVPVGTIILIRKKATAAAPASNTVVIKTTAYPTLASVDKQITSANTDKGDVAGSTFAPLYLKATGKSKSIKLTWKKVKDASGYIVYGSACGKNNKMKKITTLTASKKSFTQKKLKANTYYKYMVVAYKTIDGKDYAISKSKVVHASTTQKAKYGNPKKVKLKASKLSMKKGKKKKIKATLTTTKPKMRKHIAKFRYESANTAIATVTKKGVVKGVKKGKTYVYIYAQNGVYKRVRITVK